MNFPRKMENPGGREYKYSTEISQMMFVFGEVQDPAPETVNLVEDIVRSQVIELVSVAPCRDYANELNESVDTSSEATCVEEGSAIFVC